MPPVGSFATLSSVLFSGCYLRKSLIETLDRIDINSFKSIKGFTFRMSTGKEFQICAAKYLNVL